MLDRALTQALRPFLALLLLAPPVLGAEQGAKAQERAESLKEQSSIHGGTGLLHLQDPLAGKSGTFRVGLLFDTYKGSGFLCNASTPCPGVSEDLASHFATTFNLSVAPTSFLEAYASIDSYANSNDTRTPSLISAVGNTTFALKAFTPEPLAGIFRFGGALELGLLGSSGVVGLESGGTSLRALALAQADFRGPNGHGAPVRARLNLGYFLDNSATLVEGVEKDRGAPITRVERFGLDINRVDQFQLGLGVDGLFGVARPFAEWNLGVPVNRQGYSCFPTRSYSGDGCLATDARLSAFPSELTLGARLFPWLTGLSATAAVDIGTSGTSNFIEELAPTMPWTFWVGVGYGVDVVPPPPAPSPKPVEKIVVAPRPPELRLRGLVHEEGKTEGIAKAIVTYEGRELTGMVTGGDGRFTSSPLDPGTYTLSLEAPGYEPGQCSGTISASVAATPSDAPQYFEVDCSLKALPSFGTLNGGVRDGSAPMNGARATLRDNLGREIAVTTGADGAFNFGNVPPGTLTLGVFADGYLYHGETVEIATRAQVQREVSLKRRPPAFRVKRAAKELVLSQPVRFDEVSGSPTSDSLAVLEEVADLMARSPDIAHLEVQVHGDSSGDAARDAALTDQRATLLRDWLVEHGIAATRLSARGFGSAQPVSPNITPAGRARNRRVKLALTE